MAHDISGKMWIIDTSATGQISPNPVRIENIYVTWKTGSAGVLEFSEAYPEGATVRTRKLCTAKTLGASSAAWDQQMQPLFIEGIFQNLWLTTATNIDTLYVLTE